LAKYIETFKTFLNWTLKHRYTYNSSFKDYKVIQQPDTLKVVLTPEDISKIKKANLKGKDYLADVCVLLILSTLTGLRYSDFSRIKPEHIKQDEDGFKTLNVNHLQAFSGRNDA
jgi:integrase